MSLKEMSKKNKKATYKPVPLEELIRNLGPVPTDGISAGNREFIIHTGRAGQELFQHRMEISNAIDLMDWLIAQKRLTLEQKENLTKMLESDDRENFTLAIEIIKVKQTNGTKI